MKIEKTIEERIDIFSVSWRFKGNVKLIDLTNKIKEYDFLHEKYKTYIFFYQNDSLIDSKDKWELLYPELNQNVWDEDDSLKITMTLNKTNYDELIIIDQLAFIKELPKSPRKIISFWDNAITNHDKISIYTDTHLTSEIQEVENIQTNTLFNDSEIDGSIKITPENLFNLLDSLNKNNIKELATHMRCVISLYCLKLFCSKYRESNNIKFIFEGYNSCVIENPTDENLTNVFDTLYTIYQWIFSDSNKSSKLGILRNLVSLSNTKHLEKCFHKNLLKSLFSNYQVYMKENVKQYFEIKNKVTEFMFNLLNKSFDIYDQYKTTSRNTALAVISYFFTVIIVKSIGKQKTENLFTPEISSISLVFLSSAIIYIFMVHSDLLKKNKSIKNSIKELRNRYEQVLCDDEVEELFNSQSLSNSLNDNSTAKYHLYVILVLVIILVCVLYFTISGLGLDYFVRLMKG